MRALGRELPVNTLDQLIHQLGGPERVAEVSLAGQFRHGQKLAAECPPVPTPIGQPGLCEILSQKRERAGEGSPDERISRWT